MKENLNACAGEAAGLTAPAHGTGAVGIEGFVQELYMFLNSEGVHMLICLNIRRKADRLGNPD